ncbi:copper homeostasis membrane protein CopD [Brenneria uluponensis]|uniref:copper homeostasis membrane protein CopD n=1 Tax=Brenneria uluponensis TaxID=3057057 RepID=UPI0028EC3799|nr:copper homeostasis membrane protein CopD [Brenneria ulupoensis]
MTLETLYILLRWLHFTSVMLLTGSAFYSALLSPKHFRPQLAARLHSILMSMVWLALLSASALLAVQTGLMSGDWHNIADWETWQAVLGTEFGMAWRWQIILPLIAGIAFTLHGEVRQRVLLVSGLAQLCGLAFVGHAVMLDGWPGALQRINQVVHLIAASFWVGGLLPLLILMRDRQMQNRTDAICIMMRFSRYGHLAVALVIVTGIINSVMILGLPLVSFALYSQLLSVKIFLVALMVMIALANRYWLVPRLRQESATARHKLIRLTQLELALATVVLMLVSIFATQAPA